MSPGIYFFFPEKQFCVPPPSHPPPQKKTRLAWWALTYEILLISSWIPADGLDTGCCTQLTPVHSQISWKKLCWNRACSSGNADNQTIRWTAAPRASHTLCEYQLSWLITLTRLTKVLISSILRQVGTTSNRKKKNKFVRLHWYFHTIRPSTFTWMLTHWAKRHNHNLARTTSIF